MSAFRQSVSRRDFLKAAGALIGVGVLAACAPAAAPTTAPAEAPAAGSEQEAPTVAPVEAGASTEQGEAVGVGGDATGVAYGKKANVFGGKPIKLVLWDWHEPRVKYWQEKTPLYTQMYPNVTFDIVTIPSSDYWTKATAALPANQGPDIYHFHNSNHTPFIKNNLIEPFPEDMFDPSYLNKNWLGFAEHHFHDENGHIRYLPYGAMAAMLYFNQRLWDEAGLSEADIPALWDQLLDTAQKLTKYDDAGNIDIAGFGFNGYIQYLWNDMNYQQGRYMYTKDGKGVQIDNEESRKGLNMILKFYDQKINSPQHLEYVEGFGTEKTACTWSWTWFSGYMKTTYPELEFFTAKMPSFSGKDLPNLGRQNYEVSLVIPPQQPLERRQVAWDFMHWLYSQDENLVDLALSHDIAPAYKKLATHERILAEPTIAELAKEIEFKVFPGEFPTTYDQAVTQYIGQNIVAGTTVDQALKEAQEAGDNAMKEQDYWVVERNYGHNDAMIADQP